MREHERESARDDAFEALLAQSVAELPPEEIVADVTPWRRAIIDKMSAATIGAI